MILYKMKKPGFSIFFSAFALVLALAACKSKDGASSSKAKTDKGTPLLVFGDKETVLKDDFEYVYQKNNGGWDDAKTHTDAQYREYLDLYINFKRKVLDAEANGLHETDAFKTEFEGYRKQLAQPYLVDKSVQEELVREAYDRGQEVVSASHILLMCAPNATPADTLKSYNKAVMLRDSIVNMGKDFGEMAATHSQDPSAKANQGSLGFFSAFDMVYPFETGAYNTPVNQVSQPVRSGYGYHLIKVNERIKSTGKKSAAHLIVRVGPQYSAKDDTEAMARIVEIHGELKGGADWREMVRKYSDDPNTNEKGGDLGQGRLIPEMEDKKRELGENEFSEPFQTSFGYHIMKVTEVEPVKSFDDSKAEIKSRIARDARSTLSRERLIARVIKENDFSPVQENIDKFNAFIESQDMKPQYCKGFWRPVDSLMTDLKDLPVYEIGKGEDKKVGTVMDFATYYVSARKGFEGASVAEATTRFMEPFFEQEALAFEESLLPKKYREYRELLKEYRDGILLFTLTEEKVWRKAVEDTTGLENYYNSHKDDFRAGERVKVDEYISDNKNTLERVLELLAKGQNSEAITEELNSSSALNLTVRTQNYEKGKSPAIDPLFSQQPGFTSPITEYGNNRFRIFVLQEQVPAGLKSFDDAKSEAITQYQNFLEAEWLAELEKEYPVVVKEDVVAKLFK